MVVALLEAVRARDVDKVTNLVGPDGVDCGGDHPFTRDQLRRALLDPRSCAHLSMFDPVRYRQACPGGRPMLAVAEVAKGSDVRPARYSTPEDEHTGIRLATWNSAVDTRAFYVGLKESNGRWVIENGLFCFDGDSVE